MSVEAPLRLYISPLPRPYSIPFRRAQKFEDFQEIANRILTSCIDTGELQSSADDTPQPGNWNVLEQNGSIISSLLWQDLLVSGGTYCLVPRQEPTSMTAAASVSMRGSQSKSTTADVSSYAPPSSSPSVSSVASGSMPDIGALSPPHVSYRDALSKRSQQQQQQQLQSQSYGFFGPIESGNGVRLPTQEEPAVARPEQGHGSGTSTSTSTSPSPSTSTPTPHSLIPSGSPWAAVAASGLSNSQSSTSTGDWTLVQAKKPIPQLASIKPLVSIRVWRGQNAPSSYTVPATISVGEFIERIGGREGCRVQEMKRVREGLLPGLTYMWGTQKSIEDVGWADRKRGTVGVCLHTPPRFN